MRDFIKKQGWIVLLGLGAVLMLAGILRGEHGMVLQKAIVVCLECIGIG